MKETIWKYKLLLNGSQFIEIPIGAKILDVQIQNYEVCLWALVNPKLEKEKRCFEIFGTGHDICSDMGTSREYVGTFQLRDGALVFHLFEYTEI